MEKSPKNSEPKPDGGKNVWLDHGGYLKKVAEGQARELEHSKEPVLVGRKPIRKFTKKEIIVSAVSGPDTRPHKFEVKYKIQVFEEKYRNPLDGSITKRLAEKNTLISQKDLGVAEDAKINPPKSEEKPEKQMSKAA